MSDYTGCDAVANSSKFRSDYLSDKSIDSSESDWSPPQRKVASHKRNLTYSQSPGSDRSFPTSRKRQLRHILSPGNDYTDSFKRLEVDAEVAVSNPLAENSILCESALKSSNNCDQMLRQIIRTAYQFTRHSHRQKLTVKDLEKAFKVHRVDMKSDDYSLFDMIDVDSIENGNESQPLTCSGMWLRKPH